jgi:hypothetical protein
VERGCVLKSEIDFFFSLKRKVKIRRMQVEDANLDTEARALQVGYKVLEIMLATVGCS